MKQETIPDIVLVRAKSNVLIRGDRMRALLVLPMMAVAMMLGGCEAKMADDQASGGTETAPGVDAPQGAADLPANKAADGEWSAVRLTDLVCGDNCYVTIEPLAGGSAQDVMCMADACRPWFEAQALPADVMGQTYEVRLGTTEQFDSEFNVMDANFPAILELRPAS